MRYVFIHGAGCTGEVFAAQREAFDDALVLTLPGHTTAGAPASIAEFADYVAKELDEQAIDDAVLAGSSMGGAIALELALRAHPRVRALALLGGGAKMRVAPAIFESIERDFDAAARTIAGYLYADPTPERLTFSTRMILAVGQAQTARDFAACNAFDVTERLGELRLPILALTGERDVMMPPKFGQFIADRVPGAQARILPGAGHLAMVERPADTNDALRTFVTQI